MIDPDYYIKRAIPQETKDVIRELVGNLNKKDDELKHVSEQRDIFKSWYEAEKKEAKRLQETLDNWETYGQPTKPEAG